MDRGQTMIIAQKTTATFGEATWGRFHGAAAVVRLRVRSTVVEVDKEEDVLSGV